jgi:hypothetical protein
VTRALGFVHGQIIDGAASHARARRMAGRPRGY